MDRPHSSHICTAPVRFRIRADQAYHHARATLPVTANESSPALLLLHHARLPNRLPPPAPRPFFSSFFFFDYYYYAYFSTHFSPRISPRASTHTSTHFSTCRRSWLPSSGNPASESRRHKNVTPCYPSSARTLRFFFLRLPPFLFFCFSFLCMNNAVTTS
ncbi:LANO_0C04302g1_1 [Lachancea nothofagi CBS 11611]|uniref:LANO_0C04302g1_1 n=1 Tax=Lachancea nothofagi CBS 11611 TaxID=1266666 RepID=A0A1G4J6K2_9SACH|nr:LANO_0C04302g1_1 [Lachancea nothofagi CBS 11611]